MLLGVFGKDLGRKNCDFRPGAFWKRSHTHIASENVSDSGCFTLKYHSSGFMISIYIDYLDMYIYIYIKGILIYIYIYMFSIYSCKYIHVCVFI